ncbi:MAG: DUF2442 domain-containing protein [Bacteroides sp.]|nr:DUF2442 domain-containing protein [Prevotella sp.]MCM1407412.1 DUF2442 domain-containing protein [Treponema brennaborense]MCM1469902.1 DUF2442 domain-containing protein [Bacteroides sp.]
MRKYYDEKIKDTVFAASEIIYAKSVKPLENYRLLVSFSNGEEKVYDAASLLEKPTFAPLKNKAFFNTARVEGGTVVWNDELDLCPEDLWEASV